MAGVVTLSRDLDLDVGFEIPPHVVSARQDGTHRVTVQLSAPVDMKSLTAAADALNGDNWAVTRADGREPPRVLYGAQAAAPDSKVVELQLSGNLGYGIGTVTGATTIQGGEMALEAPVSANVTSVLRRHNITEVDVSDMRDLSVVVGGPTGGQLAMTEAGDYAIGTTLESLKAIIGRICSVQAGEFAHAPAFGAAPRLKSLGRTAELQRIIQAIKVQVSALPHVSQVAVTASLMTNGILQVFVRVQTNKLGAVQVVWTGGDE